MKIRRLTDTGEWTTRRYLSLLGNILIWAIVAIDAWYMWPIQLGGDTAIVVVSGRSMEPTYFSGDLVIARKMEPSVGDVIVYAPEGFGGSQIVHRIAGGDAVDGWVMRGDNNPRVDPFTPKGDEVKGVVLVHYANFGRVTVLLLNPMVWAFVLLAAMVLLLWFTGDECEERPGDDDENEGNGAGEGDPDADADEELDLIDRVVEGTEAAVARMVASGAHAGAVALAVMTRPFAGLRDAAAKTPRFASKLLRGSAMVAALGLLSIYGPSTASASSLAITASGSMFTKTYLPCTTATLGVTYSGTASSSGSTSYQSMAITGLGGCEGLQLNYTAYGSSGQTLASGTNFTVIAGTNVVSPGGTYDAALVKSVLVTVNGWPITNVWTGPATGPYTCIELTAWTGAQGTEPITYGTPTGNLCTISYTNIVFWGGTPPKQFNLDFTVSGASTGNWRVTINLADPYFQGWVPNNLSGGNSPVAAPGYACSQLPIFVGQANLRLAPADRDKGFLAGKSVGGSGNFC